MIKGGVEGQFQREALLVGAQGMQRLAAARVAVFGVGGVGGMVCEALARAGVGALELFDHDVISESNLNRQVIALHSTLGQKKVQVMARRILDINPACRVVPHDVLYLPENAEQYPLERYSYVVDAVDTVTAKLEIVARARAAGVPVISSMGTGNKLDPAGFYVADISKTTTCPLARVMRKELRKRGIEGLQVVCSDEVPTAPQGMPSMDGQAEPAGEGGPPPPRGRRKIPPGSISFVPAAAGLVLAGAVVRALLAGEQRE